VTSSADNSIHIFKENSDVSQKDEIGQVTLICQQKGAHDQDVNCVDWNPSVEGLLASCSDDCTIKLWQFVGDQY
jgi:WD40 repeat protein